MPDEADMSMARSELEAPYLIAASKRPVGPVPTGRCHYCDEIVSDTARWCSVACRDDWQRERR